jgi:hypothetical protein
MSTCGSSTASDLSALEPGSGWGIVAGKHVVTREAARGNKRWKPEVTWQTWPTSPAEEAAASASWLGELQQYWAAAANRLSASAKWMPAVLGAALASVAGTSPLVGHRLHPTASVIGANQPCLPQHHNAANSAGHAPAGGVLLRRATAPHGIAAASCKFQQRSTRGL